MKRYLSLSLILLLLLPSSFARGKYPAAWWKKVSRDDARGWEILPQDAAQGEVILSKRTELGIFSNLAHSPFTMEGVRYASIEGLWQGMKYPDKSDRFDPRHRIQEWPHTRKEVYAMSGWDSKTAGNEANAILRDHGIDWISYKDFRFNYVDGGEGSDFHLMLITRAMRNKVLQNPKIKKLLIQTKGLVLKPDHHMSSKVPDSFKYHEILMKIRDQEL